VGWWANKKERIKMIRKKKGEEFLDGMIKEMGRGLKVSSTGVSYYAYDAHCRKELADRFFSLLSKAKRDELKRKESEEK